MSDVEDDYLSDKFLTESAAATSKLLTYSGRRLQTQRESERKNVQNKKRSKRELEEEARREGLSKSLFDKAKEEEKAGATNKAMAMMLKMGYKPGESLGTKMEEHDHVAAAAQAEPTTSRKITGHLVEPLPLDIWSGRQGVGKRKRPVSPKAAAKLAKFVQDAADEAVHGSFRERAKEEYEERRAQGRLGAAAQTCITLDEKAGKDFNVLWLNPQDPETFPSDLLDALIAETGGGLPRPSGTVVIPEADRLRQQMRADALQLVADLESEEALDKSAAKTQAVWPQEAVDEAKKFISMSASKRLELVLDYLRNRYFYCFWCGTQYADSEDLADHCPGVDEEDHD